MNKRPEQVPIHNITTKEIHSLGFDIIDLKGSDGREYDSTVPHRHNFFELLFFINGGGKHEIDFRQFPIDNNSVHFVSPGQIHRLIAKKTKGFVICFTEDFVLLNVNESFSQKFPYYDAGSLSPIIKLNPALSNNIHSLIKSIALEFKSSNGFNIEVLRSYLNIILIKLKQFSINKQNGNKSKGTDKKEKIVLFRKLINTDYLLHKATSYYADQINISPNHLNALCKKHEGKTAIQLIQDRLLLEAKRLLYATEMTVKEISFHLCFQDVTYFDRFFKKHMRLTPTQYRATFAKIR